MLRSAASLGGIVSIPFVSETVAAKSDETETKYGYEINDNGDLVYNGPKDSEHIEEAVEGMNEAKDEGKIEFAVEDERVVTKSTSDVKIAENCPGEDDYWNSFDGFEGVRHYCLWDDCTTREIIDKMLAGAGASQIAAIITGVHGAIPAAAAAEIAAVLLAAGWQILDNNNNGEGVEFNILLPMWLTTDPWDIEPQ
ncbi:hypothetical protein ACERIM_09160 [Natrinema sp. H-ect1]|uniref:hypothetical protein n=1 Tax=Natrinema sp. H-ect1 TaxID=3242700 RepID=UPI00359CFA5A